MINKIRNMGDKRAIIIADFITDTKIRFKYLVSKTIGGMYILENQNIELVNGEVDTQIINTWDFEEVEKWYKEVIDHKNSVIQQV
ncbi:hypothetical protein DWC20_16060 [Clostridium botulinum]|uniref:hypothetical protein n=1 Tax=Clostridium botulinum TaxID=1491 RepID=UPI0019675252|nr:hypothetical protein [Clostridium botulinum]MBN1037050.1 hypothetical protein [Clostridium botulinum]